MGAAQRAELESLLRTRKLDVTLTSGESWRARDEDAVAPTGWGRLDRDLGGGLRRGHVSEIVGARSSGRSALAVAVAAAATARGEAVALIDTHDRFDPASASAAGVQLDRLLWVRGTGKADRALKAATLVLQAGGFGVVLFDVADVHGAELRQFPHTTWMRLSRIIEGGTTAAVLIAAQHVARSPGGATIALEPRPGQAACRWSGTTTRARRLDGLQMHPRVITASQSPVPSPESPVPSP
jgi:hypothetical protein